MVLGVLTVLVVLAYPFVVYVGLSTWSLAKVGLLLLGVAALGALVRLPRVRAVGWWALLQAPLAVAVLVLLGIWLDDARYLLALPVLINLSLLVSFSASLRSDMPMIERYARLVQPELDAAERAYCRRVTVAWCVFFIANGSIALALAIWAPLEWWTLYTGLISYGLIALMFAGEYLVRKLRFRRYGQQFPDRLLARLFPPARASTADMVTPSERPTEKARADEPDEPVRRTITVAAELDYFAGHYPGEPILPGTAQLHAFVLPACREQWPELGPLARLSRVKFVRPVGPGETLELELERDRSGRRVNFVLVRAGETVSSGRLFFGPPSEEPSQP